MSNRTWWPGFQLYSHLCCLCTDYSDELCLELTLTWWYLRLDIDPSHCSQLLKPGTHPPLAAQAEADCCNWTLNFLV